MRWETEKKLVSMAREYRECLKTESSLKNRLKLVRARKKKVHNGILNTILRDEI